MARNTHSFSKDRIHASRRLDTLAALNQPPQVDERNKVLGLAFWTRQSHPLNEFERSLGICLGSHLS